MNVSIWDRGRVIRIGESQSIRRKTCASATLSTKIPFGVTDYDRTRAYAVRGRRFSVWTITWPRNSSPATQHNEIFQTTNRMVPVKPNKLI